MQYAHACFSYSACRIACRASVPRQQHDRLRACTTSSYTRRHHAAEPLASMNGSTHWSELKAIQRTPHPDGWTVNLPNSTNLSSFYTPSHVDVAKRVQMRPTVRTQEDGRFGEDDAEAVTNDCAHNSRSKAVFAKALTPWAEVRRAVHEGNAPDWRPAARAGLSGQTIDT